MGNDNHIETRRNIWQNAFWGVSGTLDWEIEQLGKHPNSTTNIWSIYQRVGEFFKGVDLDGGNWHAGMTRLRSNGNLKYEKSYRDDCIRDDELADVVYLRSGDKEKAFGVITNRRANYYTLGEDSCKVGVKISPPVHSDDNFPFSEGDSLLQHYGSVSPEGGSNRLRLRKMKPGFLGFKEYKIKYYSPYNLENSIKEETRWGPQHTLDFPDMDTLDIILFEVFPIGENFKNMATDTTNSDDSLTREPKTEKEDDVKVYPNPNDGKFVVFIESPSEVSLIRVLDNLGKIIDTRAVVNNTNQYNINNFNSGSYFIEVIFNDKIVRKKLVVN